MSEIHQYKLRNGSSPAWYDEGTGPTPDAWHLDCVQPDHIWRTVYQQGHEAALSQPAGVADVWRDFPYSAAWCDGLIATLQECGEYTAAKQIAEIKNWAAAPAASGGDGTSPSLKQIVPAEKRNYLDDNGNPHSIEDEVYSLGWNACRSAMLKAIAKSEAYPHPQTGASVSERARELLATEYRTHGWHEEAGRLCMGGDPTSFVEDDALRVIDRLVEQGDEDAHVITELGRLLACIAVILKGPEPAGTAWSYHDLPELVASALSEPRQVAAEMKAWAHTKMAEQQSSRRDRMMVAEWAKRLLPESTFPVKDFDVEGMSITKEAAREAVKRVALEQTLTQQRALSSPRQEGGGTAASTQGLREDSGRLDWIESQIREYGDGYTEPREAGWGIQWQQERPDHYWPGLRAWIDEERRRASADELESFLTSPTTGADGGIHG